MGVNHLHHHAQAAKSNKAPSGRTADSAQVPGLNRPASTSAANNAPHVPGVTNFAGRGATRTSDGPTPQPPKGNQNGGRAGAKSGQPKIGSQSGNKKGMSGGRLN